MLDLIYTLTIMTITILCLVVALAIKDKKKSTAKSLFLILTVSAIGGLIDSLPSQLPPSRFYELIGQFLSVPSTGLTWMFAMSLLDDKYRVDLKSGCILIVSSVIPMMYFLTHVDILPHTSSVYWHLHMPIAAFVVIHIVWVGAIGFKDDLINLRRQARIWLIALPTSLLLVSIIAEYTVNEDTQIVVYLGAEFIGISLLFLALASFRGDFLDLTTSNEVATPTQGVVDSKINPKDKAAFERLMTLMETEEAFLDADLSVNSLANQVGIPAHQLRILINQGMGFRNFSAFLASYRIARVKNVLTDPEQARIPILSIALSSGFSSLATFNRIFKSEVGISAGEYRKSTL